MEPYDFLPFYPPISNSLGESILQKQEFYELKLTKQQPPAPRKGEQFAHQSIIARFLSSHTLYDEILLFHSPGTGKTCSAIHAIETVLENSADHGISKALLLMKNNSLIKQFQYAIMRTCTGDKYYSENQKGFSSEARQLYHLYTYATFYNEFNRHAKRVKRAFSDAVIVIDEVHDLLNTKMYSFFHEFLHSVHNRKIILLTGTPMGNNASDIALLLNLILPLSSQLRTGDEFTAAYVTNGQLNANGVRDIEQAALGRVSYLKSRVNITTDYQGHKDKTVSYPLVYTVMSEHQTASYETAYAIDTNEGKGSFYIQSLQASLFVFPDGTYGAAGYAQHVVQRKTQFRAKFLEPMKQLGYNRKLDEIREMSSKYAYIIKQIVDHPNQNVFVYINSITGSGAIILGLCLELFGYTRATGSVSKPGHRYVILAGETGTQWEDVRDTFNSANNREGKYIQVIIGGEQVKQGFTFKSIQQIHIASPEWNDSNIEQAIARGVRIGAHSHLPPDTPVRVFLHVANPRRGNPIDHYLYRTAHEKDRVIKHVEYVLKTVSVDCALTYERNVNTTGTDGSRACEYNDCLYRCKNVSTNPPYTVSTLDKSTYNLLYTNEYVPQVIQLLEAIFRIRTHFSLLDLLNASSSELDGFQLMQALDTIMSRRHTVRDRYGFPCFLEEDNNVLFLVDSIHKSSFTSAFYTEFPVIESEETRPKADLSNTLQDIELVMQQSTVNDQVTMIRTLTLPLQEQFLEEAMFAAVTAQSTPLVEAILETYRPVLSLTSKGYESSLLTPVTRVLTQSGKWETMYPRRQSVPEEDEALEDMARRGKGWVGRRNANGEFSILDLTQAYAMDQNILARMKKDKGQKCETRKIETLSQLMDDLGIVPPESFTFADAQKILKKKVVDIPVEEQRRAAWLKRGKKKICADLEEWFEQNNLLMFT